MDILISTIMKCKCCNSEIPNDSVFCEKCGAKVKKKSMWKWWIIGGVITIGVVMGFLAIVNYNRWTEVKDAVGSWPPCKGGDGVYYIVQKGYDQSLVRIEGEFPIRIKFVDVVVNGEIFACGGEHSGLGAFAFLGNDGRVRFVTDYCAGGSLFDNHFSYIGDGATIWRSDINHIYGVCGDLVCGDNCENVNTLFPYGYGQPVIELDGKWRYIKVDGNYMFEDEFDDAYPFCYGKARVCKNGKWYYIDGNNQELVIHNDCDRSVTYKVLEGEDFHYDDNTQEVVAKMHLKRYSDKGRRKNGEYWALVDGEGRIVESAQTSSVVSSQKNH